ncbi:MAG: hypothetical protein MZV49_00130, partial [Rhodopseudomonas palustris]|nr:hypothetical protein [Rhodopseudomonas palustris]
SVRKVRAARQSLAPDQQRGHGSGDFSTGLSECASFGGLLAGVQVAIDALDNMPTRFRMEKPARKRGYRWFMAPWPDSAGRSR